MSRKYFVGGNFKMNPISQEQKKSLVTALNAADLDSETEVVIAPPSLYLLPVKNLVRHDIQVAAQNCYFKSEGAYTGEISPAQLRDAGIEYVILGHSERRTLFHETSSDVAQKTKAALQNSLKVILCIGETEKEYDNHQTKDVVEGQLREVIQALDKKDWSSIVIAYEPVWAIGTGKTATPAVAQGVHEVIRQYLEKEVSAEVAANTRIIYGGSVKAGNCKDLAAQPDIDGFLVGGESLKPGFVDIDLAHDRRDGDGAAYGQVGGAGRRDEMWDTVEQLKLVADTESRATILRRINDIINKNTHFADTFREADGFLVLMHVLSTLPTTASSSLTNAWSVQESLDVIQLAFTVASKALDGNETNLHFFQDHVGYAALSNACEALLVYTVTSRKTLGCLLSLSMHDFTLVDLFITFQEVSCSLADLDIPFLELAPSFGPIRLPFVFRIAWDFLARSLASNRSLRIVTYKSLEYLTQSSHHNLVALSMTGVLAPLFSYFSSSMADNRNSDDLAPEHRLLSKILRRLFEMGASTEVARRLLQCSVKEDRTLDPDMVELVRASLRSPWPQHISLIGSSAIAMQLRDSRALPVSGFTFMIWVWFERLPLEAHKLFSISFGPQSVVELSMGSNGALAFRSSSRQGVAIFSGFKMSTSRWTHMTLVHYPHKVSHTTVRLFIDGSHIDSLDWAYPKVHGGSVGELMLGDRTPSMTTSWCVASAYLLSTPLDDDMSRFIHHLGPRYRGNFQDRALVRLLTYEASTSLNMHIATLGHTGVELGVTSSLKKAIRDGAPITESSILCKLVPGDLSELPHRVISSTRRDKYSHTVHGDVLSILCQSLDLALWSIGGARLVLRLVSLAETPHELSRAMTIFCDALRNSWQNSEDMERISGYDALSSILWQKSRLINITSFEILFEFLGLSFRSPDHSTVTNTIAYRAIALDFELWSTTQIDIQRAHLEHFAFLLRASRYRKFNARVRLSQFSITRKLLFALQSSWYPLESVPYVVNALMVVMQSHFTAEEAIKPVVSYLSANLGSEISSLPSSARSSVICAASDEKAKLVLDAVVSLLRIPAMYARFTEAVPIARLSLLWLGSRPSPGLACQVLAVIGIGLSASSSFAKKLELAGGWVYLRKYLPPIWDDEVQQAALDLLLPAPISGSSARADPSIVKCSQILPIILVALRQGLLACCDESVEGPSEHLVEKILGDLIDLHHANSSFRQNFKSQSTTEILIECLSTPLGTREAGIFSQLTTFGLLVATANHASNTQKQQANLVKPGPKPVTPATSSSNRLATVREEMLRKVTNRLAEWRNIVTLSEREKFRKSALDMRERRRRLTAVGEGILQTGCERDVWPHLIPERSWRLDETEGPHRTRKKLEPLVESWRPTSLGTHSAAGNEKDVEAVSTVHSEITIKDVTDRMSEDNDDRELIEEIAEDRHRRVRHELEPGDVIEAVSTVCRVSGVDSYPGLLIFGSGYIYMLDGLVENEAGEVIDAAEAPKGLFYVAGSIPHEPTTQRAQRWSLDQVTGFSDRSFLFRDVALEISFKDSRTLLAVFLTNANRHEASRRLQVIISRFSPPGHRQTLSGIFKDMNIAAPKGKATSAALEKVLSTAQRQWQNREISNYGYLSILNQLSGRTPNDATQYPVFPWVLKDYSSDTLDLSSSESFRDLREPMGALTADRCEIAVSRYNNLQSVGEKPFHYGTHFSSSMIVCHFMIRMAPYTTMFKTLQGGDWDLPDRLFSDIGRSYLSASQDVRGDVRELIPEFFACPEFLENSSNLDFGVSQNSGEKIHDVKLPPWAKEDALLFVSLHRQALESHYVSEDLPAWIDLIWGCKQQDVDACNVFHPLSYEGAIDLDKVTDPFERDAMIGIIHNFGQTPRKLFSSPHPRRNLQGLLSLPAQVTQGVPEDALVLKRDRPSKHLVITVTAIVLLDGPIAYFTLDSGGKIYPMPENTASPPSRTEEQVQWDPTSEDGSVRVFYLGSLVQVVESVSPTCAAFADQDTMVTGSTDSIVRLWRVAHAPAMTTSPFLGSSSMKSQKGQQASLSLLCVLRGHSGPVACVEASRAWSIAVSGSLDGSAILWDLNRGMYIRTIWHADANASLECATVHLVAINESTGYVATCSRSYLWLHTINARPIVKLDLSSAIPPSLSAPITSLAFHEREYSHLGVLAAGCADGSVQLYTWNADGTPPGCKAQWEFVKIRTLEPEPSNSASITALRFVGEILWVGDSSGTLSRWTTRG
ncbi:hypothetical protein F5I97DRAFT_1922982 [Phlebopus sp. FC_14]|nr:hypothetical protein F5I97DRAFT_1922982 [Phlebopus sp. FC_14]